MRNPFAIKNEAMMPQNNRRKYDSLNITEEMFVHATEKDSREYIFAMLKQAIDNKLCLTRGIYCNKRFKRLEIIVIVLGSMVLLISPEVRAIVAPLIEIFK